MKLKVFESNTGDCLLLSSESNHILIDGGFKSTFQKNTLPVLAEIAECGEALDLVCVSHIDSDHISGILQLMDDVLDWRVYDFQQAQGNKKFKKPKFPRPPKILEMWHNGFETQVGEITEGFESTVEMQIQASILGGNDLLAQAGQNLINGEKQAIELAHMIDPGLLNIPLNSPSNGDPLIVNEATPTTHQIGNMTLHLLGPFQEDVDQLHREWKVWLKANQRKLQKLQDTADENARRLGLSQEGALSLRMQMLANELGDRTEVSTPNLASITFLAEEDDQLVLMTGDAHSDDLIKGLRLHKFLPTEGGVLHLNALKIQHHGAEANIDLAFCQTITADHYIFCGNGGHHNPELAVVELIVNSRVGDDADDSENPNVGSPFTLWFNNSEAKAGTESRSKHMREVQELVKELAVGREETVRFNFLESESSFEINLSPNQPGELASST